MLQNWCPYSSCINDVQVRSYLVEIETELPRGTKDKFMYFHWNFIHIYFVCFVFDHAIIFVMIQLSNGFDASLYLILIHLLFGEMATLRQKDFDKHYSNHNAPFTLLWVFFLDLRYFLILIWFFNFHSEYLKVKKNQICWIFNFWTLFWKNLYQEWKLIYCW